MLAKLHVASGKVVGNPQVVRAALVLVTLLVAALVGGAPNDHGGG
jgi:hypothetical protein